ncbi:MAG: PspC domain-containing protein [Pseudonocardia sp.]
MNRSDVQVTLREMWDTRPARPAQGRQIGGVAAAIAHRYDIDPVLVRIGFVVATFFYGIGAALYIAGWALLPNEASGARQSTPRPLLVIALAVATVMSLGAVFGGGRDILLPAAAVAGLLFLLHRSRAHLGASAVADSGKRPTAPVAASVDPAPTDPAPVAASTDPAPVQPPAWDPLGAAPFAWDLPEPGPPPTPPARRRRPPVTSVTLALALLAGGVTGIVMLATGSPIDALPVLFGVVLTVVGVGLVIGAFLRAGRGLVPVALLLCALTWAVVAAPLDRPQGGAGELRATPLTAAAIAPEYFQPVGSVDVDLRGVDLSVPPGTTPEPITTSVFIGMGEATVYLPADADVQARCAAGVGKADCLGQIEAGPDNEVSVNDLGRDGRAGGRPLVLDVGAGLGRVEVRRG